jgi:LPS sulfotransferase NodH
VAEAYIVCTSPRSGSTLLCKGLAATGRAGAPAEFFDHRPEVVEYWMDRYGIAREAEFAIGIVAATSTPNGVFGTKLHWTCLLDMHRALRASFAPRETDPERRSLDDLLRMRFSSVRYIWLRRRNKVAQGISHFRAYKTGMWEAPYGHSVRSEAYQRSIPFDFRFIERCVLEAQRYEREWGAYFQRRNLAPLELFYEDLIGDYDQSLRAVLQFLGIPHSDLPKTEPQLQQLADATSLLWEQRYRALEPAAPPHAKVPDPNPFDRKRPGVH